MQLDRPILSTWRATPWVAATPMDDRDIAGILRDEVQIEFRGTGRMSDRELVPLTPAARELLHGPDRVAAHRVLRGMLGTLDAAAGATNLRGISLSSDQASFATNLLMSNIEAGFIEDSVAAGDPAAFERSMVSLIPSVKVAKAQNTGWVDLGPRVSGLFKDVVGRGAEAGADTANELSLTLLHELQHSVTPPDPKTIDDRHVWLEEGIAETLAWWPGAAATLRTRMGVAPRAGEPIDPFSARADSVASAEYRGRHRSVQRLLGLAGIDPYDARGVEDPASAARATQLLQGDVIERVPRNLARAIVRRHELDPQLEPTIRELILDAAGDPASIDALAAALDINGA